MNHLSFLFALSLFFYSLVHCSQQRPLEITNLPRDLQLIIAHYATAHIREIDQQIDGHKSSVKSLTVSSDGKYIVSSSSDATTCLWELKPAITRIKMLRNFRDWTLVEPSSSCNYIPHVSALSPDSESIASPTEDQLAINIWTQNSHARSAYIFNQKINDLAFSPCSKYLALAHTCGATGRPTFDETIHYGFSLCETKNTRNTPIRFLEDISASTVRYSPTGNHIAIGTTQGVYLITIMHEQVNNTTTSHYRIELLGESAGMSETQLAFSPCGNYLYAAHTLSEQCDKLIPAEKIENTDGGVFIYTYRDQKTFGKINIYSVHIKKIVRIIPEDRIVRALALSPNGNYLAVGSQPRHQSFLVHAEYNNSTKNNRKAIKEECYKQAIKIWDVNLLECIETFNLKSPVTALTSTPDNSLLAGLQNGQLLFLKIKK